MFETEVITAYDQVTPEWLTAVLRQAGALSEGGVASITFEAGAGNWSANARLAVTYTPEATGDRPVRLFLKMANMDLGDGEYFDDSEVVYYTRDYVGVDDAPLVRCYHAGYSEPLHRYHLLLDDVSESHTTAADRPPTADFGRALAEALATLHAHWWGAHRLAEAGAPIHDAAHIRRYVEIAEPGAGHIIDELAFELKPEWPDLIRSLYAGHPQAMVERAADLNGFALVHGDPGVTNILVPHTGSRPLYLIDRQPFDWSLTTWLGVHDLAYAMVLDWDVPPRRNLERLVLTHYHTHLLRSGVTGYSWQQLWDDYRLCVAMGVYTATEYCRGGINKRWQWVWLPMLHRALIACDDLDCRSLWEGNTTSPS